MVAGHRDLAGLHRIEDLETRVDQHLLGDLQGNEWGEITLVAVGESKHGQDSRGVTELFINVAGRWPVGISPLSRGRAARPTA